MTTINASSPQYNHRLIVETQSRNVGAGTATLSYVQQVQWNGEGIGAWGTQTFRAAIDGQTRDNSKTFDFRGSAWQWVTVNSGTVVVGGGDRSIGVAFLGPVGGHTTGFPEVYAEGSHSIGWVPSEPSGLQVARQSESQHRLDWTRNGTYTSVLVQRRTDDGSWQQIGAPAGNAATFTDTSTQANKKYEYRVAGVNGVGQSGWSSSAVAYTTPAAPAAVSAVRADPNIVVSVSGAPPWATSFDVDDDGAVVASEVSLPWTHASPSNLAVHRYRVRGVVGALRGPWSGWSATVQLIAPPNAPTGLTPNGSAVASDQPARLSWMHNPVDTSTQSAYELRHRAIGGAWTNLSGATAASRDVALSVGTHEWQVRTRGADPGWSPWSAVATVESITRPGVAVTQPDGTWPSSVLTTQWSWWQPESRLQSAWEARLRLGGVVQESRSGSGSTTEVTFSHRLGEGSWTVEVRAAAGGLWSVWSQATFLVAYTPPPRPRLAAVWDEERGCVELSLIPGAGGMQVSVTPFSSSLAPGVSVADLGPGSYPSWVGAPGQVFVPWDISDPYEVFSWSAGVPGPVSWEPTACVLTTTGAQNAVPLYGRFRVHSTTEVGLAVQSWGADVTVYIDGYATTVDPIITGSGLRLIHITGLTTSVHEIVFVCGVGNLFTMATAPAGAIFEPAQPKTVFRLGVVGDSYTDVGIFPHTGGLVREMHRLTGWDIVQLGQGATGYVVTAATIGDGRDRYGGPTRIAALQAANVDAVLVVGSANDRYEEPETVGLAAREYFAALDMLLPGKPVVVVGVEPLNRPDFEAALLDPLNTAMIEAAGAAENVVAFIDWRGEDWLTGTGAVSDLRGDGNQDQFIGDPAGNDSIHPSLAGNRYLAELLVPRIVDALEA